MKFCIIFVLTLTRDLKDTLVVTSCGAEAISFLKVYGVLPSSTLFLVMYSYLSNMLSRRFLWITITVPFFVFFVAFGFIIYPLREHLQPSTTGITGVDVVDNLLRHWIFALFYVVAEVFSTVSVGILFWQFANDVVEVEKSSSFYPLFGQISSLGKEIGPDAFILQSSLYISIYCV
jgi:ATP:ADP antiporter, AAA family